jgi:hypothetical protein
MKMNDVPQEEFLAVQADLMDVDPGAISSDLEKIHKQKGEESSDIEKMITYLAENTALTRDFLSTLPEGKLHEAFHKVAEEQDPLAIQELLAVYQPFRQGVEKLLATMDPEAYESFIDAIENSPHDPQAQARAHHIMESLLTMIHYTSEIEEPVA